MQETKHNSKNNSWAAAILVILFAAIAVAIISRLDTRSDNTTMIAFEQLATKFSDHVTAAHWKWKAEQPTSMIMLVHYNKEGREINRSPVKLSYLGWPMAEDSEEGCEKIWSYMIAEPMRVDGFRVHADYYKDTDDDATVSWCRYRLSSGEYFDYFPTTGKVIKSID